MRAPRQDPAALIATLIESGGPLFRPPVTDPFHLVLWEQVAYLADDAQRLKAYRQLELASGLEPARVAALPEETRLAIARAGGAIGFELRAQRLLDSARRVLEKHGGDLAAALPEDNLKARRLLEAFAMIGAPGADRILLLMGRRDVFALESGGLRTLLRLGLGTPDPRYERAYASTQAALAGRLPEDPAWRVDAHLALRRHGQETCRRSAPACAACPLAQDCPRVGLPAGAGEPG